MTTWRWIPLLVQYTLPFCIESSDPSQPRMPLQRKGIRLLGSSSHFYQWLKRRMDLACPDWISGLWQDATVSLWLPPSRVWVQELREATQGQRDAEVQLTALWQVFYHAWGRHLRLLDYHAQETSHLKDAPSLQKQAMLEKAMRWVQQRDAEVMTWLPKHMKKRWDAFSIWVEDATSSDWHGVLKHLGFRFIMRQVRVTLANPEKLLDPAVCQASQEQPFQDTGGMTWVPPKERRRLVMQLQALLLGDTRPTQADDALWMQTSFWRILGYTYWLDTWLGCALDDKREVLMLQTASAMLPDTSTQESTSGLEGAWHAKQAVVSWWRVHSYGRRHSSEGQPDTPQTSWCVGTYEPETQTMTIEILPLAFMGYLHPTSEGQAWYGDGETSQATLGFTDASHVRTLIVDLTRRLLTQYPIRFMQWHFPLVDKPNHHDSADLFFDLQQVLTHHDIALQVTTERLFVKESLQPLKKRHLEGVPIALWLQRWWGLEGATSSRLRRLMSRCPAYPVERHATTTTRPLSPERTTSAY